MKQEVRRGRKFIEYHDPETQDEFTFTQEISGADVSYQETDGSWHPADENWQTDGLDGSVLKNDKLNHKVRLNGKGGRTWYPRRNVNTEYMTFGVPQYWNGKRWANFSFSGWSVEGKTITLNTRQGVTILVHNRWDGIKIDWVLNNATAPSRMRYPVSLTGITYVDGIIYGADGAQLGRLTPTTATDANGAELVCSGSYSGGYVEFQADVSSATFPVTIDPDFSVDSADGWITSYSKTNWADSRTDGKSIDTTGTLLVIRERYAVNPLYGKYRSYLLFDTSAIGAGSTVTQVNLKTYVTRAAAKPVYIIKQDWSSQNPLSTANMDTAFQNTLSSDKDSATFDFSTKGAITSGNLSTAWVSKTGTTYYSLIIDDDYDNVESTDNTYIEIASQAHATESYRPVLTVTYTAAATGALRRTNMNAQMSNLTGGMHG